MKAKILGKTWDVVFRPEIEMGRLAGTCDHPSAPGKEIRLLDTMTGRYLIDTLIHECIHASAHDVFKEEFVNDLAEDISKVIWTEEILVRALDDKFLQDVFHKHFEARNVDPKKGSGAVAEDGGASRETAPRLEDQRRAVQGDGAAPEGMGSR